MKTSSKFCSGFKDKFKIPLYICEKDKIMFVLCIFTSAPPLGQNNLFVIEDRCFEDVLFLD